MTHEKISVVGFMADQVDQAQGFVDRVRIGMQKNSTMFIALGRLDVDIGHLFPMQLPFFFLHLKPL